MRLNYGVPYQGSKNSIAEWVVDHLPPGDRLVDLFAGGCAITHRALLTDKWPRVLANDIDSGVQLFWCAAHGRYRDEKRWISRDDFFALKDTDPYVKWVWSFGNNGDDYMYSREIEPFKRAVNDTVTGDTPRERYGVACPVCAICIGWYFEPDEAVKRWNTRPRGDQKREHKE